MKDILLIKNSKRPILKSCIYSSVIVLLVFLVVFIFNEVAPFGENTLCGNDGQLQYVPFLAEFRDKVVNGESLFYSFNGALGFDFYGTITYYLFSPFTFIALLFKQQNIVAAANVIIVLKMALIAFTMNYYLLKKNKDNDYVFSVLFSIIYCFSYYFLGYMYNLMWLDTIAAIPLILLAVSKIEDTNKEILFVASLVYALVCNFYMGAISCIFIVLYFIFIKEHDSIKSMLKETGKLLFLGILGVGIAGFALIPAAFNVFGMRGGNSNAVTFEFFNNIFYVFSRHLPFFGAKTISLNSGDANLFPTVFVLLSCIVFFVSQQIPKDRKIKTAILIGLFLLAFSNSFVNYVFHGFYFQRGIPNRFAVFYVFILVSIAYETWTQVKSVSKKEKIITSVIASVFMIFAFSGLLLAGISSRTKTIMVFIYFAFLICFYLTERNHRRAISAMIVVEIIFSLITVNVYTVNKYYSGNVNIDPSVIRTEIVQSDEVINTNTLYSAKGISGFNSIINQDTSRFLERLGLIEGTNYYGYLGYNPVCDSVFGVRKFYCFGDYGFSDVYEKEKTIGDITVYNNQYALSIGSNLDFSGVLEENGKIENLNNLAQTDIYKKISIKDKYETDCGYVKIIDGNIQFEKGEDTKKIYFDIKGLDADSVFMEIKCKNNISGEIRINNNIYKTINMNTVLYIGKDAFIEFLFNDAKEEEFELCFYEFDENAFVDFANSVNTTENITVKSDYVKCDYYTDKDEYVSFSIPYNKGWSATVNGKETEVMNIDNALIKIPVNQGENIIELKYTPQGLITGICLSALSAAVFAIYIIIKKKKEKS